MADERRGRARKQHLAAVARVAAPPGLVDRVADVPVGADARLAGVEAHAHAQLDAFRPLVLRERALAGAYRRDRRARAAEDDEEGVALGVDLDPARLAERLAQEPAVRAQHLAVAVTAERLEQARRALDVGEQEGHRARGQGGRGLTKCRNAQFSVLSTTRSRQL